MPWEPTLPIDPVKKAVKVEGVAGGTPVPVTGSFTATTTAHATAAAPVLVEGSDNQLSADLSGNLRTLATATTAATATAADPAYAEGSTSPISQDRTGHLRTTGLTDTQLRATAVPVSGPLTDAQLRAAAVPVSAASLPLPAGAATGAKQDTGNTILTSIDTKLTNPLPVSGAVTDAKATAAAPAYVEASNNPLSVDLAGNLRTVSVGGTTYFPITESSVYVDATTTLTLTHTPTDTPRVFVDRIRQVEGTDYTRSGAVITWITIPPTGAYIQVDYTWSMASSTLNSTLVVDVSGNVQPTGDTAARSIHVTVDSAATQAVSAASLPLPTGAATELSLMRMRQAQELALLVAIDSQRLALASRGRERISLLSQTRGSR